MSAVTPLPLHIVQLTHRLSPLAARLGAPARHHRDVRPIREGVVLTDSARVAKEAAPEVQVYGEGATPGWWALAPLVVGWWRAHTGEVVAPHLLVVDPGAWASGVGPPARGGVTLVPAPEWAAALAQEAGKGAAPGLGEAPLRINDATGEVGVVGTPWVGWDPLHTAAFFHTLAGGELELVMGQAAPAGFGGCVAVGWATIPPWPYRAQGLRAERVVVALPPQVLREPAVWWHDAAPCDGGEGEVWVGGGDGAVAVCVGVGRSHALAHARLSSLLGVVGAALPGRQTRNDLGALAGRVLLSLEALKLL